MVDVTASVVARTRPPAPSIRSQWSSRRAVRDASRQRVQTRPSRRRSVTRKVWARRVPEHNRIGGSMPRGRRALSLNTGALATIRALRDQIEVAKQKLRDERAAAIAKVAEIDQALAELGETAPANATSPPPVREPTVKREPHEVVSHGDARTDRILDELKPLAPWLPGLRDNQRAIVGMRLGGQTTSQIAAKLGKTVKDVSNSVFAGRARLRELKSRGAPAAKPASDSDDESEPAPASDWSQRGADGVGYVGPANEAPLEEVPSNENSQARPEIIEETSPPSVAIEGEPRYQPAPEGGGAAFVHLW